jgi:hypothetical protein
MIAIYYINFFKVYKETSTCFVPSFRWHALSLEYVSSSDEALSAVLFSLEYVSSSDEALSRLLCSCSLSVAHAAEESEAISHLFSSNGNVQYKETSTCFVPSVPMTRTLARVRKYVVPMRHCLESTMLPLFREYYAAALYLLRMLLRKAKQFLIYFPRTKTYKKCL